MKYTLPQLAYAYDALEPFIDARTMEIHHAKHHQAYIDKLNAALEKYPNLADKPLLEIMKDLPGSGLSEADQTAVRNHGGGHLNHSLFWQIMDPANSPDAALISEIAGSFGSIEAFKEKFNKAALLQFGSGWAWLARDEAGKLVVYSTPNQDSPLLKGHTPIIGLDVWEHAYYLNYQNRRADYIQAWWNTVKIIG